MDSPAQHRGPATLARTRQERMLAGVCGGLARRTNVDPIVYRVAFGVLGCLGVGVFLYGAAWVLLPRDDRDRSVLEGRLGRHVDGPVVLAIFVAVLVVPGLLAPASLAPPTIALIVVLGIAALTAHQRGADLVGALRGAPSRLRFSRLAPADAAPPTSTQPDPRPSAPSEPHTGPQPASAPYGPPPLGHQPPEYQPPAYHPPAYGSPYPPPWTETATTLEYPTPYAPSPAGENAGERRGGPLLTLVTLGVALIVAGVLTALAVTGPVRPKPEVILAAAVLTIGLGLLLGTWYGHGRPLVAAGLVASIALVATAAISVPPQGGLMLSEGFGVRTWQPHVDVRQPYQLGAGEATLDLTGLREGRSYDYTAKVGMGELLVRVPADARVIVHVDVKLGEVVIDDEPLESGPGIHTTRTLPATVTQGEAAAIELHLAARIGEVRVIRVSP